MLRDNRCMRQPDRPEPGTFTANHDNLAERLARLPDRHPSSPARDREAGRPDETGYPADQTEGEAETGEPATPEDTETADAEEPGQDESGDSGLAGGRTAGLRPVAGGSPDRGGKGGQGPYRPWFADGGPGEPWFAADLGPGPATPGG
jgi:hypothetical protein